MEQFIFLVKGTMPPATMTSKRVAIIGAGVSGLTAIKACLEEDLHPVCYEIKNNAGGLWNYSEDIKQGIGSVMKSTLTNISKELMSFSDFPMPASAPNYLKHDKYLQYLLKYAAAHDLQRYIRFETEVLKIKRADSFSRDGRWMVETKVKNGEVKREEFDFVMVCTGIHNRPYKPEFPGLENFGGRVMHSHELRNNSGFEGKRILVIGFANTGTDVATDLCQVASQVFISTRTGNFLFSRVNANGYPFDFHVISRSFTAYAKYMPHSWVFRKLSNVSKTRFPLAEYGIEPKIPPTQLEPVLNDYLPTAITCGQIIICGDVKEFTQDGVVFEDGSKVEDIDVVVMATGYEIQFPFLDEDVVSVHANKMDLFNCCIPPELDHPTLALIAMLQVNGPYPMVAELQSRYVTRVFKKLIRLPGREEMWENLKERNAANRMRYKDSMKNSLRTDCLPYLDVLAEAIGCKPNLGKMLLTDPKLAWACFFWPLLPFQYRLTGPGKWPGARDAILTLWDRIFPINKNGKASTRKPLNVNVLSIIAILLIPVALYLVLLKSW